VREIDQCLDIDSRRATVRSGEAAIGNLIADAMRNATGADVAITNGGGIRGDTKYPRGAKLTRKDILTELPFGNKTVTIAMIGADIIEALEHGFAQAETISPRFPQVSGLSVTVDLDKATGHRVTSVTIDGAPLDPAEEYVLATNDFLARGGDGYDVLADGEQQISAADGTLMASQVIDYIAAKGSVTPKVEGRIVME